MSEYRIGQAAALLGVSPDTIRRWADAGRLEITRTEGGHRLVDGRALARLASETPAALEPEAIVAQSARNRFTGIVTRVVKDEVMAQVDMHAGPLLAVSLISREAPAKIGPQQA